MSGLYGSGGPVPPEEPATLASPVSAAADLADAPAVKPRPEPTAEAAPAVKPRPEATAGGAPAAAAPAAEPGEAPRSDRERARRAKSTNGAGPHEPAQMLDLCELPETYGRDEVGILTKDPQWYFVYWEVTKPGEAAAREQLGPSGEAARLVLRLFTTLPGGHPGAPGATPSRESRELRDVPLPHPHGRKYLEAPRPGAMVRAAVGLLSVEGYFAPIAHSALVRMPLQQAAPQTSVEWLHVLPPRSQGHKRERIVAVPPAVQHEERSLPVAEGTPVSMLQGSEAPVTAQLGAEPAPGSSPALGAAELPAESRGDPTAPPLGHGSGGLG